jgi:hypothetical protein
VSAENCGYSDRSWSTTHATCHKPAKWQITTLDEDEASAAVVYACNRHLAKMCTNRAIVRYEGAWVDEEKQEETD